MAGGDRIAFPPLRDIPPRDDRIPLRATSSRPLAHGGSVASRRASRASSAHADARPRRRLRSSRSLLRQRPGRLVAEYPSSGKLNSPGTYRAAPRRASHRRAGPAADATPSSEPAGPRLIPAAMRRNASARCLSFSARARSAESSSDSERRRSASESSSLRAPASRSSASTASSTSTRAVLSKTCSQPCDCAQLLGLRVGDVEAQRGRLQGAEHRRVVGEDADFADLGAGRELADFAA